MASRTRIISQNKAVYASTTGIYGGSASTEQLNPQQLNRIDTLSFDVDLAGSRQDIREFGQLSRIGVQTMSDIAPSVSLGYYLGDGKNEILLGLYSANNGNLAASALQGSIVSGITAEDPDYREKNLYVLTAKEGEDAFNSTAFNAQGASHDVIGFGNCVLTNYTANFAVGEIPRADVEMEASNIVFWTGSHAGLRNPAINEDGNRADQGMITLTAPVTGKSEDILVLRPDDVHVTFKNNNISKIDANSHNAHLVGGTHFGDVCVQSCSVELPLSRGNIECLGKERAYAKPLEFPINVTLNMSAVLKNFSAGALENVLTGTAGNKTTDIQIQIKKDNGVVAQHYDFKDCYLDNQSFSQGLDDNETVDLTFSTQIGGASNTDEGVFWSGQAGTLRTDVNALLAKGAGAGDFYAHQPLSQT